VKVGGSLRGWPGLGPRLRVWLAEEPAPRLLLVPGGGPATDVVRGYDGTHGLGEEVAHWLALRALALNAHALAKLVPGSEVVAVDGPGVWQAGTWRVGVVDAFATLEADERRDPGRALPHTWDAASDTVAARVARVAGATRLVLLKSADAPSPDWAECARRGFVDPLFPGELPPGLDARAVNLRR
jgi:aspartokinase-like uncharacterized kinase